MLLSKEETRYGKKKEESDECTSCIVQKEQVCKECLLFVMCSHSDSCSASGASF